MQNVKTWQERCNSEGISYVAAVIDEIYELRAALQERDAEIETARRTADYWKAEYLAGNAVIEAQRKVLEQALDALQLPSLKTQSMLMQRDAAITAIQEVLA